MNQNLSTKLVITESIISAVHFGNGYLTVTRDGVASTEAGVVAGAPVMEQRATIEIGRDLDWLAKMSLFPADLRVLARLLNNVADHLDADLTLPGSPDPATVLRDVADTLDDR